jgi:formamidopyrimidine-DNA glycosylase
VIASPVVPELPDLAILQEAFQAALVGRPLLTWDARQSLVVRATSSEVAALVGVPLDGVARRGKFLTLCFGDDRVVVNPMLTGRMGLGTPGSKALPQTAVVLRFGARRAADRPDPGLARWTAGAHWIPVDDATVELRYRDPTRMGKVYVLPHGVSRSVAGWDDQGPDADDPAFELAAWRARIVRHSGELKGLLKNQAFVAGIGNGYSDEVLWAAGLAPFRKRSSLAAEEVDGLYTAMREVMAWAIAELRRRVPPRFEIEVRDFLRVHRKGASPCPRCGTTVSEISPGGFVTSWCRACQR